MAGHDGYINKAGVFVINPVFESADNFSQGLARVRQNGLWGYIDKSGSFVIGPRPAEGGWEIAQYYPDCKDFSEGLVARQKNGKFGYLDKSGSWVIPPQFHRPGRFSNGLAAVQAAHLF